MDALCWILSVLILHSFTVNDVSAADNPTCDQFDNNEFAANCRRKNYSKVPRIVVPVEYFRIGNIINIWLGENNFAVLGAHSFVDKIDKRVTIWMLELRSCNIESIDKDAFKGLEHKVERLDLNNNKLAEVPTDAITPLKSLRWLTLKYNPIRLIGENAFSNMNSLSQLDLSECEISIVKKDAFKGLEHKLQILFLGDNKLAEVPTNAITPLKSLQKLTLSSNRIERIGENAFSNMNSLSQLDLNYCIILLVDKDAFKGLEDKDKLEILYLGRNKLAEVPTDAISPLKSLRSLSLENNPIERIRENAFSKMTSLSALDLSSCRISIVEKNAFGSLDKLEELGLDRNMIKTLPWEDFERLRLLKKFDISSNPIEFYHCSVYYDYNGDDGEMISKSITVRVNEKITVGKIYCSSEGAWLTINSMMYLMPNSTKSNLPPSSIKDPSFYSRSDVKSFAFWLSKFSCGYRRYTCEKEGKIVSQDEKDKLLADFGTAIACNRIRIIDDFNWNVDCAKGNYTSIPTIILPEYTSHYLKTISIDLSGNDFSVLRENSFVNMVKENATMWKLNLAQCNTTTIMERAFDGLQGTLIELDLSGNKLVEIPKLAIGILVQLQTLILNGNSFAVIRHDSLPQMKSLRRLEMSSCNIIRIDVGAFNTLKNLQSLILDGNCLKTLSADAFDRLDHLNEIRIRELVLIEFKGFSHLNNCNCVENDVDGKKDYEELSLKCETSIESNIVRNAPADPNYSINQRLFTNEFVHDHDHFYCEKTAVDSKSSAAGGFEIKKRKLSRDDCMCQTSEKVDDNLLNNRNLDIDCANGDYSSIPSIIFPVTLPQTNFANFTVNLAGNNFTRISANAFDKRIHFRGNFTVFALDLSSCKIVIIEKNAFKSLESLVHLRLGGNRLQTISFNIFDRLERLALIDLRRNPLDIDLCWWEIEKLEDDDDSSKIDYDFNVGTEIVLQDCKCLKNKDVRGFQSHISCQTFTKGLTFSPSSFGSSKARPGDGIKMASDVTILMDQFTCNFHNFECGVVEKTNIQLVPTVNQLKNPEEARSFMLNVDDEL